MHDIRPYLPELFTDPGLLLYIGARADAHSWLNELAEAGNTIRVIEAWRPNVLGLLSSELHPNVKAIYELDVRDVDRLGWDFDYIFWWHGPEHLYNHEIPYILGRLEYKCYFTIALACPWGQYPQGAHEGNPYEEHRTTLYPEFFTALGYEVATDGEADRPGSEVVAWKRMIG